MSTHREAVIVGAGFGGMGAAIQLKRMGYDDIVILERESDLGGTWHVNRYPGLAVDIPSSTYSYSFEPNPYWSRLFAPGSELKKYAVHVADTYDLRRHMRFDTVVTGAEWDEAAQLWHVTLEGGEVISATYLLTATGFLSQPKMPDIEGIDSFAGEVIHTTAWRDDVDLTGKRIGIIGTGATAVQLIPELAKVAGELTVYQRTPIYVTAKSDLGIPKVVQKAFAAVPLTQKAVRLGGTSILEILMVGGVVHYKDFKPFSKIATKLALAHLRRQVKDPETRRKLTPDYTFGCKRPTFSNTYYPTFNKPNVHLETGSITHIDPAGIATVDGRHDLDVLVLATGFNLWDANFPAIQVVGREGKDLGRWWRDTRFQAYEGITVPGFPNFLCLNAPYSYSGLSYFTTVECQMKHMGRLFAGMKKRGAEVFEVTEEANTRFLERMRRKVDESSVFALGSCASANSYYFNQHGEATLLRPTSTVAAHREAVRFPLEDYAFA